MLIQFSITKTIKFIVPHCSKNGKQCYKNIICMFMEDYFQLFSYLHRRQSGVNSAGARRGFSGILLQNTQYIYTNLKQIPRDDRKCGGTSAPPAPPCLAPRSIYVYRIYIDKSYLFHINHFNQYRNFKIRNNYLTICYSIISGKSSS